MKKAQFDPAQAVVGTSYPPPHDEPCRGRKTWPLTGQFALTQFGVNRVELGPLPGMPPRSHAAQSLSVEP